MTQHFLVTGGGGFIGSHMVRFLLQQKHAVRVLDNFITGNRANLAEVADGVELIDGDIRNREDCLQALEGITHVVHLAALPSVPRSIKNPMLSTDINVNGTVTLLEAARESGVKRLVFASSSSVYGNSPEFPRTETQKPAPVSPYAVSKLAGEYYLRCFYELHGLETVALRFFNVFGPRQNPNSQYAAVIPRFIQAVLEGRPPTVYGDGEQSRDFTFIADLVDGIYRACQAAAAAGEVMNVACGRRTSLNQLLDLLRALTNKKIAAHYTDPRPGDVRHSMADIEKAKAILDFEPRFSIAEGLAETYRWYESQMRNNGHAQTEVLATSTTAAS